MRTFLVNSNRVDVFCGIDNNWMKSKCDPSILLISTQQVTGHLMVSHCRESH